MIDIHAWLRDSEYETKMLLQVHDELVFEVPISELEIMKSELPSRMSGVVDWEIPLSV